MGYEGKVHGIHGFLLTKKAFIKLAQDHINQRRKEFIDEEGLDEETKARRLELINVFDGLEGKEYEEKLEELQYEFGYILFLDDFLLEIPDELNEEWKKARLSLHEQGSAAKVPDVDLVVYALPHDEVDLHEKGDGRFAVIGVDTSPDKRNKIRTGYSRWEKEIPEGHLIIGKSPLSSHNQIIQQLEKYNKIGQERFEVVREKLTTLLKEKGVETINEEPETFFAMTDCLCCT
jgi:hypothetical protein